MRAAFAAALLVILAAPGARADGFVLLQSTTSTQNSGLYDWLLPQFTAASGIEVRVVAVGTGQALRNAERCDGDVVIVHDRAAEDAFVAAGFAEARHDLMANDFVLVGPVDDPAGTEGKEIGTALDAIAEARAPFVSRGDDSGTHRRERALWSAAGADPGAASGTWYREVGAGMGAALNIAVGMGAYTLTDRASWTAFGNRAGHRVLVEGGPALRNPYGILAISPTHCPNVRVEAAAAFLAWMLGAEGQAAIAAFRVAGEQLFWPANP